MGEAMTYEIEWQGLTFESHIEPLRDAEGTIIGTIGVALDITERKLAEEYERRLAIALESVRDAIIITAPKGASNMSIPRLND